MPGKIRGWWVRFVMAMMALGLGGVAREVEEGFTHGETCVGKDNERGGGCQIKSSYFVNIVGVTVQSCVLVVV